MNRIADVTSELVAKLREWLGEDGLDFFGSLRRDYGTVAPVLGTHEEQAKYGLASGEEPTILGMRVIPYPVHFRDGMKVRNFLRQSGLCEGWSDHDYDETWMPLVEAALEGTEIDGT